MEKEMVTIPLELLIELTKAKARIEALETYVSSNKYPERNDMCSIVGVEYKED